MSRDSAGQNVGAPRHLYQLIKGVRQFCYQTLTFRIEFAIATIALKRHGTLFCVGKPGRRGYHNVEWGKMMKAVGLYPSATGEEGGKESGERVSHYILKDGLYQRAYRRLAATGLQLHWQTGMVGKDGGTKSKSNSKVKYTCSCGLNAWAKPGVLLTCGECEEEMVEE